jgi:hypothetical protein
MMKKPKPKKRKEILDYHECAKYIAKKLGIKDLRDVDGKFDPANKDRMNEIEYKDFWHQICDGVHNGSEMYMIDTSQEDWPEEEWVRNIAKAFNEEFGSDAVYWVEW